MLNSSRRPLEALVRDAEGNQIARCLIRRGRYVIGHEAKNEIVVSDPSVSGRHARLTVVSEDEIYIEDLKSVNGTSIDDVQVQGSARINLSAKVTIGLCTLDFQRSGLPAAAFHFLPEGFLRESRYNLGEAVVAGTTSTIFSAFDITLGRDVAVKVLRPESQAQLDHVLRFIREAQIMSQLQHPGILTVYELGLNERKQLFYTTRFIEGGTLGDVLDLLSARDPQAPERFPLTRLLVAFQKVCDAVAYAHSRGVIHAALCPETISLGFFGEVVVINWCFARILPIDAEEQEPTRPVTAAPSESIPPLSVYTAPEIAADTWEQASARTDVYALGAILFRMVTLHRPFDLEDKLLLRGAIMHGEIRSPAKFAKEPHPHCPGGLYPGQLVSIALKAMSNNPADRFLSVPDFQAAIAEWQDRHDQ